MAPAPRKIHKTSGPRTERSREKLNAAQQKNILFRGMTVMELSIMFNMQKETVQRRLSGKKVSPIGTRNGTAIYRMRDVAPYLAPPTPEAFINFMKTGRLQDVHPILTKEYWNGYRSKQAAMLADGDLWQTDRVVEIVSELFKLVRMRLLLIPDDIERKTQLSAEVILGITQTVDETLADMKAQITEAFGKRNPNFDDEPGIIRDSELDDKPYDDTFDMPEPEVEYDLDDEEIVEAEDDDDL